MPERDLEARPVRGEQRDGDEVEVDEEAERALTCRPSRTSPSRGKRRQRGA